VRLEGDVEQAARSLLGALIVHDSLEGRVAIRITEVEAYSGEGTDAASHAHRGRTPRNQVMFGPAGYAYVYFVYGMHWCMNVVTGTDGSASAALLRAGEVVEGVDLAHMRRPGSSERDLARGPARLAHALGVDGAMTGTNLLDESSPLRLERGKPVRAEDVSSGPRVGIRVATEMQRRFWITGDRTVSDFKPGALRRR
jgi:DNA-3-methyladenine glycosylase